MDKTIGRSSDCDNVILDPKSSIPRKHVVQRSTESETYNKDISSAFGTYSNGVKISTRKLFMYSLEVVSSYTSKKQIPVIVDQQLHKIPLFNLK
jgi:pSer/pThr/pTyr-binding forkhead associated (FHA) protein